MAFCLSFFTTNDSLKAKLVLLSLKLPYCNQVPFKINYIGHRFAQFQFYIAHKFSQNQNN